MGTVGIIGMLKDTTDRIGWRNDDFGSPFAKLELNCLDK